MSKEEILAAAALQINIPSTIEADLDLPTKLYVGEEEVSASWHSTASKVIDSEGNITPNVADKTATLTVTLEYLDESTTLNFDVTVKGNEAFLVIYAVLNSLVEVPTGSALAFKTPARLPLSATPTVTCKCCNTPAFRKVRASVSMSITPTRDANTPMIAMQVSENSTRGWTLRRRMAGRWSICRRTGQRFSVTSLS